MKIQIHLRECCLWYTSWSHSLWHDTFALFFIYVNGSCLYQNIMLEKLDFTISHFLTMTTIEIRTWSAYENAPPNFDNSSLIKALSWCIENLDRYDNFVAAQVRSLRSKMEKLGFCGRHKWFSEPKLYLRVVGFVLRRENVL